MKNSIVLLALTCILLSIVSAQPRAKELPQGAESRLQSSILANYQLLNINNVATWLCSDGLSARTPRDGAGVVYPRGTAAVVYQDGIVWGAKAYLDAGYTTPVADRPIRVGGQTYNIGTKQGWIIGQGAAAVPVDPMLPEVRVYRIRRDFRMNPYDLTDAAEFFGITPNEVTSQQMQQLYDSYLKDWNEWPVNHGAPYIERNGIPGYQPPPSLPYDPSELITNNYDEPGIAGIDPSLPADMVIWTAYNDLDTSRTWLVYGSPPLGLEVQVTMWAYNRSDVMGQMYFKRVRIINKGGVDIGGGQKGALWLDSMTIAQWTDSDIGEPSNDLLGCDPNLNAAYTFNATSTDLKYSEFSIPPPALGYCFLYGPVVPGGGNDSAVFNFRWLPGKRNLGMTSFSPKGSGSPYGDPMGFGDYETTLRWWRWIQGYLPDFPGIPWRLYPHPPGMEQTKFPLSGDPVMRTGFIDGLGTAYSFGPGDRRFTASSGLFRLAPGDTQEVVLAVAGGMGADNLSSILSLKYNLRFARTAANMLFGMPSPPQQPTVKAIELNKEIVLDWGSDSSKVASVEKPVMGGRYAFEGYNIYQLPSSTSSLKEGVRIATFDIVNGVQNIVDDTFDPETGLVYSIIVQRGTDSGVRRFLSVKKDFLRNEIPLRNGSPYYFAVTAYNYSDRPDAIPKSVESVPIILGVKPRVPFGVALQAHQGDTLAVEKLAGKSTGSVVPIVVDPLAGTGDTYEVGFDTASATVTWKLKNISRNRIVIENQENQSGDTDYPIVEGGIYLKVITPPPGLKQLDEFSTSDSTQWGWRWLSGTRHLTWTGGNGLHFEAFGGAVGWASPRSVLGGNPMVHSSADVKNVEIRFTPTDNTGAFNPTHPNASYAYRYGMSFSAPPARPEFAQWIINTAGGFSYQDYRISVPLAVYDVDANPPRRLAIGFLENNVVGGTVNGFYWPPSGIDNTIATGPREWLFIFDADYTGAAPVSLFQANVLQGENMPVMYFATWTRLGDSPWPDGNVMALYANKPNSPADRFSYTVPAPVSNQALQKQSATRVGVFPNPFYADQAEGAITYGRFVTFTNLPLKATIRIFNLAGHLVRTLTKDEPSQYLEWDLKNESSWFVASGMYICYIDMPEVGATKILKLAIVQGDVIPGVK